MNDIKSTNEKKSNYEILCIIKESDAEQKKLLVNELRDLISPGDLKISSEVKKLAYPIKDLESAEYLLLEFETSRNIVCKIETSLRQSVVIRYMLINLETEKRIKVKKQELTRIQKISRKYRKTTFENSGKSPNNQQPTESMKIKEVR